MIAWLRSLGAVLAGVVAAGALIAGVEFANTRVFPMPAGVDPSNPESLAKAMAQVPPAALATVLVGHAVGTFAGAWVAARLAGRARMAHAAVIGGLFSLAGAANLVIIPSPAWFWVLDLAAYPSAAYLGGRLAAPRPRPRAALAAGAARA